VAQDLINAAKRVVANSENNIVDRKKLDFLTDSSIAAGIAQAEFILSDGYTGSKGYPVKGDPLYGKGFTTIIAGLMHPLARGSVHINSSDESDHPIYDPAFASNEYDLQALVTMAKYIRTIAQSPPFSYVSDSLDRNAIESITDCNIPGLG
jgi:choline dehydrogenase-like flavoprotein